MTYPFWLIALLLTAYEWVDTPHSLWLDVTMYSLAIAVTFCRSFYPKGNT